jgi:arylsulfatase A
VGHLDSGVEEVSLRFVFSALALAVLTLPASAAGPRLNVIVILADDLGWADLGCYGSSFHRTPALDRLAKQGVRFTDAYASCPVCSPTRAALLTGKAPARLGLTDWLPGRADRPDQPLLRPELPQQLALEEVTLAEAFKAAGYVTGHIGKWHLGGKGFEPTRQGFDVNIAGDHTGTPRSYFAPFRNKQGFMPGLERASDGEYLTDRLAAEAERFLDANKDRPFFLYLPHHAVHTPLRAKADYVKKYSPVRVPGKQSNAIYAAMLESLDDAVGRVLAKLDELKLSDRTIVVFTSDNGGLHVPELKENPPTHNTPFRAGKGFVYEGGLRVPLIVRWPGMVNPGVSDVPVVNTDFLPTLAELAGLTPPEGLDGVSFAPLLLGKGEPKPRTLYWHFPHYNNQGGRPAGAVREGDWKLVTHYDTDTAELYNLAHDKGEANDLAARELARVKVMLAKLQAWREKVKAQVNSPNPDCDDALYRQLYVDVDVSKLKPERTAAEMTPKLAAWRKGMDEVVPRRKP